MSRMYISNSIMNIILITGVLSSTVGAKGVPTITAKNSGGFSLSRVPALNLFTLQCNGSHLPNDVRTIQAMNLKRSIANSKADTIASVSMAEGVRLENRIVGTNAYVSGVFDADNIQGTYLTVLMDDIMSTDGSDVTYICLIIYSNKDGDYVTVKKKLVVAATDIQGMHHVRQAERKAPLETDDKQIGQVTPSPQSHNEDNRFNPPMLLLIVMAGLLFILIIVCIVLVVDRCKENRRQRLRAARLSKRQSTGSKEFKTTMDPDCRPLPTPPNRSYPLDTVMLPYKNPYHTIKLGSGVKYYTDDAGYDSDASMLYARPLDDVGEVIPENNAL